jgi:hypothetical protein
MSKQINISSWVASSKLNPDKYILRQIVEILLNAIGQTAYLKGNMFLKGGTLMALAHESHRTTGDVDFSWIEPFHKDAFRDIDAVIKDSLNESLNKTRTRLGYLDLNCKVQSIDKKPSQWKNSPLSFPALKLKIGYAKTGTRQENLLLEGSCSQTLEVDISFNEDVLNYQELVLDDKKTTVNAYTPIEIISEKFRALIQQIHRGRNRRQDIYDINFLLERFDFNKEEKKTILENMLIKAHSRKIFPKFDSLSDNRVKEAAKKEWQTMSLELSELPDFELCYQNVEKFYKSLPW